MDTFGEIFNKLIIQSLNQVYQFVQQYGPSVAFSFAIIVIGWVCAVLVKKVVSKLLKAFGFDVLSEKIGFKHFLEKGEIQRNASSLTGLVLYWIILLNALIMAQEAMHLKVTSQFLQKIVLYIPNIIVTILFIATAVVIGKFAYKFVNTTARLAGIPLHGFLGSLSRYAVFGIAAIMILEYLNISRIIVSNSVMIIFGIIPVLFFLVFLIGGRDIISNILNGRFLAKELKNGDMIEVDTLAGKIISIDLISTRLKSDKGETLIPNSELAKKIIRKK